MIECETQNDNRVFINCIGDKCEDYTFCKKKQHHVWYRRNCLTCGKPIETINPKKKYCSHTCIRSSAKDVKKTLQN